MKLLTDTNSTQNTTGHLPQLTGSVIFLIHEVLNGVRGHNAVTKTDEDLKFDWRLKFIELTRLQQLNYLGRLYTSTLAVNICIIIVVIIIVTEWAVS